MNFYLLTSLEYILISEIVFKIILALGMDSENFKTLSVLAYFEIQSSNKKEISVAFKE